MTVLTRFMGFMETSLGAWLSPRYLRCRLTEFSVHSSGNCQLGFRTTFGAMMDVAPFPSYVSERRESTALNQDATSILTGLCSL